jgi:hypothetical protein
VTKESRSLTQLMLDFSAYVVIGIGLVIATIWFMPDESAWKWIGFTGMTLILFGYSVKDYWGFSRRLGFWLVIASLVAAHTLLFIVILSSVKSWKVLWYVALFPPENIVIDTVLARAGYDRLKRLRKREGKSH